MDRSMIHTVKNTKDLQKFTESFLCDEIHYNFRTLALIYPFGDEFKEIFEKGMFIKPNSKAFPHVMKYLFTICDPVDFRRKFCWPIYNKAAEATFRNSTLELLSKLNTKYELGFGEVKNKILIFPGGMEFMRVIYELSRLSMHITLKQNGVPDLENQRVISLAGARKHLDDLEELCKFVMDFKKQVEEYSEQLKEKTERLHKLLQKVTVNTNIKPENILHDKFTESWENVQNDIIDKGIQPDIERFMRFQNNCEILEEKVNSIFNQQTIKFDQHALARFSTEMQKQYPQMYHQLATIVDNGRINLDHILQALPLAIPSMLQAIESHKPRSLEAMAYESNRLKKISHKADELLQKTLQLSAPNDAEKKEINFHDIQVAPQFESIQSMILSTPTISHDAIRRAECAAMQSKRISLLEDTYQLRSTISTVNLTSKPLNSIMEESMSGQKQFLSPQRLFSKELKAKLDPLAMLHSITKKEKKEKHLSNGNFKLKTMNFGLRFGQACSQHDNSKANDTILSVPDFSSTLLNQSNDIRDTQHSVNEQINQSLARSADKNVRKMRSLLAISVHEQSDRDINSSPSGRIEPLVISKLNLSEIKPIQLLDKHSDQKNSILSLSGLEPIESKSSNGNELTRFVDRNIDLSNIENNQNAPNSHQFNLNMLIDENDESLFNMSDRILNNSDDIELT